MRFIVLFKVYLISLFHNFYSGMFIIFFKSIYKYIKPTNLPGKIFVVTSAPNIWFNGHRDWRTLFKVFRGLVLLYSEVFRLFMDGIHKVYVLVAGIYISR